MFAWRDSFNVSTRGRPNCGPKLLETAAQRQNLDPHAFVQFVELRFELVSDLNDPVHAYNMTYNAYDFDVMLRQMRTEPCLKEHGGLRTRRSEFRFYDVLVSAFVVVLLVSNLVGGKICAFGSFRIGGGELLFPITYIFGDVFTEVYGYAASRRAIWIGFFA